MKYTDGSWVETEERRRACCFAGRALAAAIEAWLDDVGTCELCGGWTREPPVCGECEFLVVP